MMRRTDYTELRFPEGMLGATVAPIDVLLIEDNPDDVELVMAALDAAKIVNHFTFARSVEEAVARLEDRRRPDLIIVDVMLGAERSGLEVFRCPCVKADDIPVVVYSAHVTDELIEVCGEMGARAFIPKPLTGTGLREVVERIPELKWAIVQVVYREEDQ